MFCGFYALILAIRGEYQSSAIAILLACVFDMLDGRVARLTRTTSVFGVEYDSLSDLISFGAAPAILLYVWALHAFGRVGWLGAFLFMACGALRLARFNAFSQTHSKNFFMGVPIPVAAGIIASFVIYQIEHSWLEEMPFKNFSLILCFGLGSLMVSTIPFPTFKQVEWKSKSSFGILLLGMMSIILIAVEPTIALFWLSFSYVGSVLIWNFLRVLKKLYTKRMSSRVSGQVRNNDKKRS